MPRAASTEQISRDSKRHSSPGLVGSGWELGVVSEPEVYRHLPVASLELYTVLIPSYVGCFCFVFHDIDEVD